MSKRILMILISLYCSYTSSLLEQSQQSPIFDDRKSQSKSGRIRFRRYKQHRFDMNAFSNVKQVLNRLSREIEDSLIDMVKIKIFDPREPDKVTVRDNVYLFCKNARSKSNIHIKYFISYSKGRYQLSF